MADFQPEQRARYICDDDLRVAANRRPLKRIFESECAIHTPLRLSICTAAPGCAPGTTLLAPSPPIVGVSPKVRSPIGSRTRTCAYVLALVRAASVMLL